MPRTKSLLVLGVVALLGAIAIIGASTSSSLTVPGAMNFNSNFTASPAAGAQVSLAFPNIRVNTDNTQEAQNEPFVAVNPQNSRHIIVGANNWQAGNGRFEVTAYVSFDGGQTWTASSPYIDRNASRLDAADPTVAFGSNGRVYFGFVALTPALGAVAVSTSLDGGLTWSSQSWATSFATAADKPAIASANGKLYVFYQNNSLNYTVSTNGATWASPASIEAGGRNAAPVVDRSGNVYVFYNTASSIKMARPVAGSRSTVVANTVALQPRQTHYRAGIYPAAGIGSNGTMYVAWADGRNAGMGNDIMYSRSVNGSSWSAPARVNTDAGSADQLMPALAVGSDGAVTIAWLDNRNDAANVNYDVYMSRSTDGVSFGANQRVTSVSSNPNNDPRTQGQMIGDYFALGAGSGVVYPAWTDTRNNNADIYLAPVATNND
jgi:hypothetical protein